jgi:hypothetical protein
MSIYVKTVIIALILVATAFLAAKAFAHIPYTTDECARAAGTIKLMADFRDKDVTIEVTKDAVVKAVAALGPEEGYVKDENDLKFLLAAADIVYSHKEMTGDQLASSAYKDCRKVFQAETKTDHKTGLTT